jgi:hypothetical protein
MRGTIPSLPSMPTVPSLGATAASVSAPILDSFDRANGALGSNWSNVVNSHTIVSNAARSTATSFAKNLSVWVASQTPTLSQWLKLQHVSGGDTSPFLGFAFRYVDANSPHYLIDWNGGQLFWGYYLDAASSASRNIINGSTALDPVANNDFVSMTIIGTGAATRLRVWKNPTGDAPDAGGTTWGSASPLINQLIDVGGSADVGLGVGICTFQNAQNASIGHFSAGSIS